MQKKLTTIAGFMLLSIGLVGCSTIPPNYAEVEVFSEPPGAYIYENGVALGAAPIKIYYEGVAGQTVNTKPLTAVWVSGATSSQEFIVWTNGTSQYATIQRPMNAPNLQADLQYAADLEREDREKTAAAWRAVSAGINAGSSRTIRCKNITNGEVSEFSRSVCPFGWVSL
jgi:hypothetical protein